MKCVEDFFVEADYPVTLPSLVMDNLALQSGVSRSALYRVYPSTLELQEAIAARLVHHKLYPLDRFDTITMDAVAKYANVLNASSRHSLTVGTFGVLLSGDINPDAVGRLRHGIQSSIENPEVRSKLLDALNQQHVKYLDAVAQALQYIARCCSHVVLPGREHEYTSAFTALAHGFASSGISDDQSTAYSAIAGAFTQRA